MALKKYNPGCNCCEVKVTTCEEFRACFNAYQQNGFWRTDYSFEVEVSGVQNGSSFQSTCGGLTDPEFECPPAHNRTYLFPGPTALGAGCGLESVQNGLGICGTPFSARYVARVGFGLGLTAATVTVITTSFSFPYNHSAFFGINGPGASDILTSLCGGGEVTLPFLSETLTPNQEICRTRIALVKLRSIAP